MKDLAVVLAGLERRLSGTWHQVVTGDPTGWPVRLTLGKPSRADLEARFTQVRGWARDWQTWADAQDLTVEWETRLLHGTRQPLPTHLTVPDADVAARLLGPPWPDRLARGRARHRVLTGRFPHAATAEQVRALDQVGDIDFDLLCTAADWFTVHDATGYTPRQVPIEGLHGKWLNRHRALLTTLTGRETLGLTDRPTRIHFTYLDPDHRAAGGRRHDSLTLGDAVSLPYVPRVVVIAENKDSAILFPPLPGGIAVEGGGNAGPTLLPQVRWVADAPRIVYWGDLDAAGYEIVNRLRGNGVPAETILMDQATYDAHQQFGAWTDEQNRPLPCAPRKDLSHLADDERAVYERLTDPSWTGPRRIEQERIPLAVALAAVTDG